MSDVTRILAQLDGGDAAAAEQLLPLVYDELRKLASAKLAQESSGQTLQATALVHEAYLRLVDVEHGKEWDSRGHFFAAASEAMRRILVDTARRKASLKRGGELQRHLLDEAHLTTDNDPQNLLALDEALNRLAQADPLAAKLVQLRYFAGLTVEQAASALGVSTRSAYNTWTYARSWLHKALREG
jgi:RNA polymerase sigma factor (TIGR02999 family)